MHNESKATKVLRNTFVGCLSKLCLALLHLVSRKLFLRYIGLEYLSVAQVINSLLTVFSFTELGLFNSVLYMLYQPTAEQDDEKVNRILNQYRSFNRFVGVAIIIIGGAAMPFLHLFIKTSVEMNTVYVIYVLNLLLASSSYFLSYRRIVLNANQEDYKISLIEMICTVVATIVQCVVILLCKDYLAYLFVTIIFSTVQNAFVYIYVGHKYSYIRRCKRSKATKTERVELVENIKGMFAVKVAGIVINNTDNILVSWIDTLMVGLCSNYTTISVQIKNMITILQQSLFHSLGIAVVGKSGDDQFLLFKKVTILNAFIASVICVPLGVLWNDFIVLWIGEEYLLDNIVVWSLLMNFCILIITSSVWMFRDVNGLFIYVKKVLILNAIANVLFSLLFGMVMGVAGVYWGTLAAMFCTTFFYDTHLLYKKVFKRKYFWKYNIYILGSVVAITLVIVFINCVTEEWPINVMTWCMKGFFSVVISAVLFIGIHYRFDAFRSLILDFKRIIERKER